MKELNADRNQDMDRIKERGAAEEYQPQGKTARNTTAIDNERSRMEVEFQEQERVAQTLIPADTRGSPSSSSAARLPQPESLQSSSRPSPAILDNRAMDVHGLVAHVAVGHGEHRGRHP